jgi:hypothetical protein
MVRNGLTIKGKYFHYLIQDFHPLSVTEQPISRYQECDTIHLQHSLPLLDQWSSSPAHSTLFLSPEAHTLGRARNITTHPMTSGNSTRISPVSHDIETAGQLPSLVLNTRYSRFDPSISNYIPSPGLSRGGRVSPWSGSSGHSSDHEDFEASVSSPPQVWTPVSPSPYFLAPPVDPQSPLLDNYIPGLQSMVPCTDSPLSPSPGCNSEADGLDLVSTSPLQHVSGYASDPGSSQCVSRPASSSVSPGAWGLGDYALVLLPHKQNSALEVTSENPQGRVDRPGTIASQVDPSAWNKTVGSSAILEASRRRRKKEASWFCTWPGCMASFTAKHNLGSKLHSI